jgi:hypothetical protein
MRFIEVLLRLRIAAQVTFVAAARRVMKAR